MLDSGPHGPYNVFQAVPTLRSLPEFEAGQYRRREDQIPLHRDTTILAGIKLIPPKNGIPHLGLRAASHQRRRAGLTQKVVGGIRWS